MTKKINKLLINKIKLYKQCKKGNRKKGGYETLLNMTTNTTARILNSKENCFDNLADKLFDKLFDPKLNRKAY